MRHETKTAVDAANRFSRRWAELIPDENTVVSGVGAWSTLALLLAASSGPATNEMADVVGLDQDDALGGYATIAAALDRIPGVAQAAAVWSAADVTIRERFVAAVEAAASAATTPGAAASGSVAFGQLGEADALDDWVTEATSGLITSLPCQVDRADQSRCLSHDRRPRHPPRRRRPGGCA